MANLHKYQRETKAWRDMKVMLQEHDVGLQREHQQAGGQVCRTISPIRSVGQSVGGFLDCRKPSPFFLMNYKGAFAVVVESSIYFQGPYSFPHRRSPQVCEVFSEMEPMYPEATIKASFPPKL
jgi:hypothetical protein